MVTYSISNNNTKYQIATNAFSFLGLLFDVLAACKACIGIFLFQRMNTYIKRRESDANAVISLTKQIEGSEVEDPHSPFAPLRKLLHLCEENFTRVIEDLQLWGDMEPRLVNALDSAEVFLHSQEYDADLRDRALQHLARYQRSNKRLMRFGISALGAYAALRMSPFEAFLGAACLLIGLIMYVINEQPMGVWLSLAVSLAVSIISIGLVMSDDLRSIRATTKVSSRNLYDYEA